MIIHKYQISTSPNFAHVVVEKKLFIRKLFEKKKLLYPNL